MMREEFEKLTGIAVSLDYYEKYIEPEYMKANMEKQDFVTYWTRKNKDDIGKALKSDIQRMSVNDSAQAATIEQYKRTEQCEREKRKEAEEKVSQLESRVEGLVRTIKHLESDNKRLQDEVNDRESAYSDFSAAEREITETKEMYAKTLAEKDMEIMKLKALLFDSLYKTA